ncbi:PIN domain-containing protein [Subtercola endophyticus]|uniref:PIN domain-containing protein n=1 Tax=Subtercola endophyticus TaxID=2895559 RepID=UPI001E5FBE24|nr:PIN domain-containing protein [Subtercola endophyticus]UFS60397.1 PIN domain-containing protein [Subtercola endophyticus]
MIVLDTSVLSELTKPQPAEPVVAWFKALADVDVRTTSISAAELLNGVAHLPAGRRAGQISQKIAQMLDIDFAGKILAFDYDAAVHYADIASQRFGAGRPISVSDAMIAATARAAGAHQLITRNAKGFFETGLVVINPWDA